MEVVWKTRVRISYSQADSRSSNGFEQNADVLTCTVISLSPRSMHSIVGWGWVILTITTTDGLPCRTKTEPDLSNIERSGKPEVDCRVHETLSCFIPCPIKAPNQGRKTPKTRQKAKGTKKKKWVTRDASSCFWNFFLMSWDTGAGISGCWSLFSFFSISQQGNVQKKLYVHWSHAAYSHMIWFLVPHSCTQARVGEKAIAEIVV